MICRLPSCILIELRCLKKRKELLYAIGIKSRLTVRKSLESAVSIIQSGIEYRNDYILTGKTCPGRVVDTGVISVKSIIGRRFGGLVALRDHDLLDAGRFLEGVQILILDLAGKSREKGRIVILYRQYLISE